MRNKLLGRYEMLQMTSRFDGLPDFLLRRLKENEFVKGKTHHHPTNIQLSINVKLHYNKIIIWPTVCVRVFAASLTHTHTCLPCWSKERPRGQESSGFHAFNATIYIYIKSGLCARPFGGVQVAHYE